MPSGGLAVDVAELTCEKVLVDVVNRHTERRAHRIASSLLDMDENPGRIRSVHHKTSADEIILIARTLPDMTIGNLPGRDNAGAAILSAVVLPALRDALCRYRDLECSATFVEFSSRSVELVQQFRAFTSRADVN